MLGELGHCWRRELMRPRARKLLPSLAVVLMSLHALACAVPREVPARSAWTVTLENDVFTGSDNNYTNGIGISWVSADTASYAEKSFVRAAGELWSFLPFVGNDGYRTYVAWSLGQEMHTPDDITQADPPPDDQPYAGVLYLDHVVYAKGRRATHAWQLRLGVVGSASQAEPVQKAFHKTIGADKPRGWDHQLPNEPIVNVAYTGAYLLGKGPLGDSMSWRIVPVFNAGLGNYFTGLGAGVYVEVGKNLVDALGGSALRQGFNVASTVGVGPVDDWSVSLSGGMAAYGVVHYLPLDGTVLRESRSVDSKPSVTVATIGVTARHRELVAFLGVTSVTRGFAAARKRADFGSLSLSWYC
jgi:hypothetical protein